MTGDWRQGRIKDLIDSLESGVSVNGEDRIPAKDEPAVLKVSAITYGVFDQDAAKPIYGDELDRAKCNPKAGQIIISRASGTAKHVGACAYIQSDCQHRFLPDKLWQTVPSQENETNLKWLYYFLSSPRTKAKILNFATGTNIKNVTKSELLAIPVLIPPLPEQTAIANLLSTWDEAIEKTERLIRVKEQKLAGMFQQYMGERAAKEKRWPETSLGKIFSEIKRKVGDKDLDPYSISAGIGFVSQCEKWGKNISGAQHKNYTHLKAGEFAYNKGNSKRYQQGCAYLLHKGEICVPNVFISFKPDAENIIPEFYEHYFVANYHARELKRYITSGARSDGLLNLRKSDFLQIKVPFPPAEEQQEIAEILSIAQQEIDLLKQLTEKYKTQKRGLMQKLLAGEWRVKTDKEATQCH